MKKLNLLFVALCALTFISCEMGSSGGDSSDSESFPSNKTSYTIPSDENKITIKFPSSANGKQCFIIYSNEKQYSQMKTVDTIKFNIDDVEERSAESQPELKVYKNAVQFSDGFYRDEIQFNTDSLPKFNLQKSGRAARAVEGAGQENYYNKHEDGKFFVYSKDSKNITQETFELIGESPKKHCRLWFCKNTSVDKSQISTDSLATAFDAVFEKETAIFGANGVEGSAYAITCDDGQQIDILIYDIFGDAKDDQTGGVFGYFRPYDFYQNVDLAAHGESKSSNECQVISVDSYFLKLDQKGYEDPSTKKNIKTHKVESTIIHEFQHLLNFCNKSDEYSTWFTEMLAMSAEDVFQSQIGLSDDDSPKSRFAFNFDQPNKGFKNWPKDTSDENVYYCYANAYAFGAYLMRNFGGIELINLIATNPYIDEAAITSALQMLGYKESFESVFQKFGMVYIFNKDTDEISLNKTFTETFNNVSYTLTGVDIRKYPFVVFNSENELLNYVQTYLYYDNETMYNKDYFYLFGPRIYKSNYIMIDPIQTYGFTVFYAGQVKSGKTLTIKRKSDLSVTVVLK